MTTDELIAAITSRLDYIETKQPVMDKVTMITSELVKIHAKKLKILTGRIEALEKKLEGKE